MTRRRRRAVEVSFRPPLPRELDMYCGADWGAPPDDGSGEEWAAGHHTAYARYQRARADWFDEYGHMPVDPSTIPGDEPWCGDFDDHDCGGD